MAARRTSTDGGSKIAPTTRILVLHGPEQMRRREYFDQLRQTLSAEHGEIDPVHFDGETAELADVLDELRTLSLLQPYKIVVVHQAGEFVKNHRRALERYAESPVSTATLVLQCDIWHKGNLDKAIGKVGAILACKPASAAEAATWLVRRAKLAHQRQLSADAANLLVRRLGCDLMRLDSELAKLAVMVDQSDPIDPEIVELLAGRASDEQAWAIQQAVLEAIAAEPTSPRQVSEPAATSTTAIGSSLAKIHDLVELSGQSDVLVTYAVADLFRRLYLAEQMLRQGAAPARIGRELKLWGPRQRLVVQAVGRLGGASIARLFDGIVAADRRAKSGRGQPVGNLECFMAQLADELT